MNDAADWVNDTVLQLKEDNSHWEKDARLKEQEVEETYRNLPRLEEDTILSVPFKELIWFKGVCDDYEIDRRFDRERKVWIVSKGTLVCHVERWLPQFNQTLAAPRDNP